LFAERLSFEIRQLQVSWDMAKQVVGKAAFQVPGGKATPAPPVGTSLGRYGINLGQFVSQFNDRTREFNGTPIPVVVTVYSDRSFEFITKSPPASALLKMAAGEQAVQVNHTKQRSARSPERRSTTSAPRKWPTSTHAISNMPVA
jgi:ribosomal protein L11